MDGEPPSTRRRGAGGGASARSRAARTHASSVCIFASACMFLETPCRDVLSLTSKTTPSTASSAAFDRARRALPKGRAVWRSVIRAGQHGAQSCIVATRRGGSVGAREHGGVRAWRTRGRGRERRWRGGGARWPPSAPIASTAPNPSSTSPSTSASTSADRASCDACNRGLTLLLCRFCLVCQLEKFGGTESVACRFQQLSQKVWFSLLAKSSDPFSTLCCRR